MSTSLRSSRPLAGAAMPAGSALGLPPALLQALVAWAALGLLAMLLLPAARGHSQLVGWMPFWCVVAPLSCLLVAAWHALLAAASAFLASRQHRPLRRQRTQARRVLRGTAAPALPRRLSRRSPAACAPCAARTPR